MGTSSSSQKEAFASVPESTQRVVVLGLPGAGKTTLLRHWGGSSVTMQQGDFVNLKPRDLDIWSCPGSSRFRVMWPSFLRGARVLVFVIDASNRDEFADAQLELSHLRRLEPDAVCVLIANKSDVPGCATADEVHKAFGNELKLFCVSAQRNQGVGQVLTAIATLVFEHRHHKGKRSK